MRFLKSNQYVLDFKKNTKTHFGTTYSTREDLLKDKKIVVTEIGEVDQKVEVNLSGTDLLQAHVKLCSTGEELSSGRFLDSSYEELVFSKELANKGVVVECSTTKVGELFVTIKHIKKIGQSEIDAVIQEITEYISEDEYKKSIGTQIRT